MSARPIIQRKVCLLGDFAVGKTSLVRRYVEARFDERYLSTVGAMVSRKTLERPHAWLNLLIWDIASVDDLATHSRYLVGAVGALLVCDLTRLDTLPSLERYARSLRAQKADTVLVLVANKADLSAERQVSDAELAQLGAGFDDDFLLSSAKTGEGVELAFERLAQRLEPGEPAR